MPESTTRIGLYFGPPDWGGPDELLAPIIDAVAGAKHEVVVATQQLRHPRIVEALVNGKRRGIRVRVVVERDYVRESSSTYDIWMKGGVHEDGRHALMALLRGAVDVRVERRSRLLHNNFIVVDAQSEMLATTISTSANLTLNGLHRNLNHLMVIRDHTISQAFMAEFTAMWTDELASPHSADPPTSVIDGMSVKVVFGPEHGPEMEVIKQISKARREVCFSVSSFSKTSGVDDALLSAISAGVDVQGILDDTQGSLWWSATDSLERHGAHIFLTEKGLPIKLHHKVLVVDEAALGVGTFNYSASGARLNEEVVILLWASDGRSPNKLAKYAKEEMSRIMKSYCVSSRHLIWG